MRRVVVRFEDDLLDRIAKLRARCVAETGKPVRRAALVRLLVERTLRGIDLNRPVAGQLPLAELETKRAPATRSSKEAGSTLRARILAAMRTRPDEVFTPARLAPLVRAGSRDTIRNTLLVLAQLHQVEKVGPGRYRSWPSRAPTCTVAQHEEARS